MQIILHDVAGAVYAHSKEMALIPHAGNKNQDQIAYKHNLTVALIA